MIDIVRYLSYDTLQSNWWITDPITYKAVLKGAFSFSGKKKKKRKEKGPFFSCEIPKCRRGMILFAVRPKFESRSIAEEYSVRLSEEGSHYFNCSAKSNLTRQNPKQNSVTSTNRTRHIMQSADHLGRTNEPQTQTSPPFNWRRDAACKKGNLVCACERVKRQLFCKFVRIG